MANVAGFGGGLNITDLQRFLNKFVVEIVFVRRRKPKDPSVSSKTRRMICTTNQVLLQSDFGKRTLRYKPATQSPPYNARAKGLITVWDIMMQDWRNIDVKSAVLPAGNGTPESLPMAIANKDDIEKFKFFYTAILRRMNPRQFMDS
jgi:hypothetical protein